MKKSRYNVMRKIMIFWTLFVGIGALAGSICMIVDPTGGIMQMGPMLPYFQKLPFAEVLFQNFLFPGIALLIVNGLTNFTASVFLFLKKKIGIVLGMVFGITLMLWIVIQFVIFPCNFLSTAYFIIGFLQALCGIIGIVFYKQEQFEFNAENYTNIGTNHKNLVVFFSRMGYVKKVAYEKANETGADIYEVKTTERSEGTLGFWWCGRYGMHKWAMPIQDINIDLTEYDHVTICSPIWVFHLSAPIRSFCMQAKGQIKEADYVLVHFKNDGFFVASDEMDELLGLKNSHCESISCKTGTYNTKNVKTNH